MAKVFRGSVLNAMPQYDNTVCVIGCYGYKPEYVEYCTLKILVVVVPVLELVGGFLHYRSKLLWLVTLCTTKVALSGSMVVWLAHIQIVWVGLSWSGLVCVSLVSLGWSGLIWVGLA